MCVCPSVCVYAMLKTQTSVSERRGGGKQEEKVVEESKREVPRENSYAAGNSGASAKKKNWLTSRFFRLPIFETFLFVMGFLICLHFPFNSSFFSVTISLWGADKNNKLSRKRRLTKRGIGVKREICFFFPISNRFR